MARCRRDMWTCSFDTTIYITLSQYVTKRYTITADIPYLPYLSIRVCDPIKTNIHRRFSKNRRRRTSKAFCEFMALTALIRLPFPSFFSSRLPPSDFQLKLPPSAGDLKVHWLIKFTTTLTSSSLFTLTSSSSFLLGRIKDSFILLLLRASVRHRSCKHGPALT